MARLQYLANLPDLTAPLQQRQRFGRYIYNFIFLPPVERNAARYIPLPPPILFMSSS